jgi:hypothetical protein
MVRNFGVACRNFVLYGTAGHQQSIEAGFHDRIFHPQAQPFVEPHFGAVQELGQSQFNLGDCPKQSRHLGHGQRRFGVAKIGALLY